MKIHLLLAALTPLFAPVLSHGQAFVPEDISIGGAGVIYGDPEFLPASNLMTFQEGNDRVWVGRMDARTGGFLGGPAVGGREFTPGFARAIVESEGYGSLNGPEWGLDASGPSVLYSRRDSGGVPQLFTARPPLWTPVQATHSSNGIFTPIGSFNPERAHFLMLGAEYFSPGAAAGEIIVADMADPDEFIPLEVVFGTSGGRYIPGTADVAFIRAAGLQGHHEIFRKTIAPDGPGRRLTADADGLDKQEVWPFFAPEFGGELLYAAIVARTGLRIYRDADGDGLYTVINHLTIPAGEPHIYLSSVEPVVGQRGAFGRSYFGIIGAPTTTQFPLPDASLWLFRLTLPGEVPFTRRVDSGSNAARLEPEMYVGENELFAYYSEPLASGGFHRCRTGIGGPQVTLHPAGTTSWEGGSVTLTSSATGPGTITYHWQWQAAPQLPWVDLVDGTITGPGGDLCGGVSGAASATLHLASVQRCLPTGAAPPQFRCVATNAFGSVPSHPAGVLIEMRPDLTFLPAPPGEIRIGWPSHSGYRYQAEYSLDLATGSWLPLGGPVTASGDTAFVTDLTTAGVSRRFYRVTELPR